MNYECSLHVNILEICRTVDDIITYFREINILASESIDLLNRSGGSYSLLFLTSLRDNIVTQSEIYGNDQALTHARRVFRFVWCNNSSYFMIPLRAQRRSLTAK